MHGDVTPFAAHSDAELKLLSLVNANLTAWAATPAALLRLLCGQRCSAADAVPLLVQGGGVQAFAVGMTRVLAPLAMHQEVAVVVTVAEAAWQAFAVASAVFCSDLVAIVVQDDLHAATLGSPWWWVIRDIWIEERLIWVNCRPLVSMVTVFWGVVVTDEPGVALVAVAVKVLTAGCVTGVRPG